MYKQSIMKSQFENKPPLCRFINNCRDFKQTQKCKFLHDLCNKKDKCEFGEKCRYYHPELAAKFTNNRPNRDNTQSLIKKTPCRFGQNCRQKDTCKFSHETNVQRPTFPPKSTKQLPQCTYGSKCNKFALGQCKFKHSNMASVSGPVPRQDNTNRINTTGTENLEQKNPEPTNFNAELQDFERNKLCRQFAIGQCKQGDSCQMLHQFGLDNNIKRIFFRTFPDQQPASSKILCTSFKINQLRIFALARGRILGFYELDFNFTSLKGVSASELKIQECIVSLGSTNSEINGRAKIIFTTRNKRLHVYNPIQGIISSKNYNIPEKLTGAIQFSDQQLLFISNEQTGLTIEKNNEIKTEIIEKINSSSPDRLANITTMKVFQLFGSTFTVFGTQQGNLTIINTNFESKCLHISDSPVKDICAAIYWQKPFLFAIVNMNQRKSQVISINMLDFTTQAVIEFEDTVATRICSNHNRLFIGVENLGVLVYFLSEFPKLKSRIQLIGSIQLLECDNDGNLTIISRDSQQGNSSLSIYRLRK